MRPITIAVGQRYVASARAMQAAIPSLQIVADLIPADRHGRPAIAARLAKTNFAAYLPAGNAEPVLLVDADMEVIDAAPISELTAITADVAGCTLQPGRHFYPGQYAVVPPDAAAFSSGCLYFRNGEAARTISAAWRANYARGLPQMVRDEPNLALALHQLGSSTQELDGKFNSVTRPGAVFYHATSALVAPSASQIEASRVRQIMARLKRDLQALIRTWPVGDQYDFDSARQAMEADLANGDLKRAIEGMRTFRSADIGFAAHRAAILAPLNAAAEKIAAA